MQTGLSSCDHETLTGAVDVCLAQENFGVREFLRLGIIVPGASDAVADVKKLGVFALHRSIVWWGLFDEALCGKESEIETG